MQLEKALEIDPYLKPFEMQIHERMQRYEEKLHEIEAIGGSFHDFVRSYEEFGLRQCPKTEKTMFKEWAPNAVEAYLMGDFSKKCKNDF